MINDEDKKCLKDLWTTDLDDDKTRIQQRKGDLLKDSYVWILKNPEFQTWRDDKESRLLWIKGDPGKGKTMLLCGIIDELKNSLNNKAQLLAFFFCQATDSRTNNAIGTLRGLICQLVSQQSVLMTHVRKEYDRWGKEAFEGDNAWIVLSRIFTTILGDRNLKGAFLIIDGLDECTTDLRLLLVLIVQASGTHSNVKWIVSSRNWPSIEKYLNTATHNMRLSLELNEKSISAAVTSYIKHRVEKLAELHNFGKDIPEFGKDLRDEVQSYMLSKANNTFLWVSLVCQKLSELEIEPHLILSELKVFPSGLDNLYRRMMDQISNSKDAVLCTCILAIVSVVYRPIILDELLSLIDLSDGFHNNNYLIKIIQLCGSFLTVQGHTISFIHQTAKDFLVGKASKEIFPSGKENVHHTVFSRSLQAMSRTLRRDIYDLGAPGFPVDQVKRPEQDPLTAVQYSCIYWVDHLHDSYFGQPPEFKEDFQGGGMIDRFLRERYLHWVEALSLLGGTSEGALSMLKLRDLAQVSLSFAANIL